MSRNVAPMLWPAVALVFGIHLADVLVPTALGWWVGLLVAGLCWRGDSGRLLAFLAFGLLWGTNSLHRLDEGESRLRPERVVEVVARQIDHPRKDEYGFVLRARILRVKQGRQVSAWPIEIWLSLPEHDESPPGIGTVIRVRGYLKRSPGYANHNRIRPGSWRMRVKSWRLMQIEHRAGWGFRWLTRFRTRSEEALQSFDESSPGLALVRALVLGQRQALPTSWRRGLRRSGLAHLTAVSGLHVGLLFALLWGSTWWLGRGWRLSLSIFGVLIYLLLIGPHPSMIRATTMAILCTFAILNARPPVLLNALACCVVWMVLVEPTVIDRLGFQLSVAATGAILLLAPRFEACWPFLSSFWRRSTSASLAAQLGTLPFTLPLLGGWHPASLILNPFAVPWLAMILVMAFPFLGLAILAPRMAAWLLPWLDGLAVPLDLLSSLPASNGWYVPWATGIGGCGLLLLVLVALGSLWPWKPSRRGLGLACGATVLAGLLGIWTLGSVASRRHGVEIVLFDVGQGDALLLRDGERTLLVDGGGWRHGDFGGRVLLPALAAEGIRQLDAILMTHSDRDHCGGLVDLVDYLPVGELLSGPGWADSCGRELLTSVRAPWRPLWRGERFQLAGWNLEVLSPEPGERGASNDRSLVVRASWGAHRLLLTGDIEARTEKRLLRSGTEQLRAEILKVAHHGSKTSTSAAFLRAVNPRLALISAGRDNPHGHPSDVVLRRLRSQGRPLLRTDRDGFILLRLQVAQPMKIFLPSSPY